MDGDITQGWAQVLLRKPDDAAAHVLFKSVGVEFHSPDSLQPKRGVINLTKQPDGTLYAYRYRH